MLSTVLTGLVGCRYWTVGLDGISVKGAAVTVAANSVVIDSGTSAILLGPEGRHQPFTRCALSLSVNWCCATCEPDSQHVCACLDTEQCGGCMHSVPLCTQGFKPPVIRMKQRRLCRAVCLLWPCL